MGRPPPKNSRIKAGLFSLSRWLLHLWIRPTILGNSHDGLELTETDLICYVLPFRSLADLLVVDKACEAAGLPRPTKPMPEVSEARAFFFVGHPEGAWGRRSNRRQSPRLARLFEQQQDAEHPIKFVPVSLFWGHQPDREKSLIKLLLSENWSATSRIKKFLAALFHRSHILVQFSAPIHLQELTAATKDRERQIRKLLRILRVHFNRQKLAILGPDLSHRRTLLNTLLASPNVRQVIERQAKQNPQNQTEAEKKAKRYAKEIAADQSYRVVRYLALLLSWLWNKLYDGIEVHGLDQAKQLAQSHELIYTPCHRSHIDYLLLSYVLYHNGLTPPHIAAGENLNLPVIGPLLRRGGAFFMRRSFKGDPLYKVVFDEYLHLMFTKGYSVEYFIEGSRSRTGRTLPPKGGMLSMTMGSFMRDSSKPFAFLPVYLGYERVLESSTYMAELSGEDKRSESMFDIFKIFSSFRYPFGRVTVNFGEPVRLQEFLEEQVGDWQGMPADAFSASCSALAHRLVANINAAAAVKATGLVALALLATTRLNIEEGHLESQVALLLALAEGCGPGKLTLATDSPEKLVADAMNIIGLSRQKQRFGNIISASPAQAVALTYNANNIVHVYLLPSLVTRYLRAQQSGEMDDLLAFMAILFPYLDAEMFLDYGADQLDRELQRTLACLEKLQLVEKQEQRFCAPSPMNGRYNAFYEVSGISDSTLERFYIVIALLQQGEELSQRQLEVAAAGIAEQLSALYGINSPDFFERSLFASFLNTLKQQGVVTSQNGTLKTNTAGLTTLEAATALTLSPNVRYNILQAVGGRARASQELPEQSSPNDA